MEKTSFFRGRRLRSSASLRALVRENQLHAQDFIMPYFVADVDDAGFSREISSMPGQHQLSLSLLEKKVGLAVEAGLKAVILFGIPRNKDAAGTEGYTADGIMQKATRLLKKSFPQLIVMTDVCLCEYTSHGHCGLLSPQGTGEVMNDPTLELLSRVALSHAEAGADIVAPSDMMDGRVQAIRKSLDAAGFVNLPIASYAVKYASAYYGPFREAAESTPQFGDRKSYQMDPANGREALREMAADVEEGADMCIVKPAGPYLDVLRDMRNNFSVPLLAYQVSGEYSMIKAAGQMGWISENDVILESLLGMRRAGADLIITYFTEHLLLNKLVHI